MSLSRRGFLGVLGGAGVLAAGLTGCGGTGGGQTAELLRSRIPLPPKFRVPLPIPPEKKPTRSVPGADHYDITQRVREVEIVPGYRTPVFGYDGMFPGPTIRSRRGRTAVVTHHNELPVPAVVHLHGGHTPPEHDGYPVDLIHPEGWRADQHGGHMAGDTRRGSREYVYPLDQPAATLWYHDHRMDFTAPQVWRGLAGFHLVQDDVTDALPLPHGDRDIPLMICDRAFAEDGSFRYPALDPSLRHTPGVRPEYMEGVAGDVILVNGAPWPTLEVAAARYRFRILNASNARRYRLTLRPRPAGGDSFAQIASDAGLLAAPVPHDRLDLAPAERFEVVVDFSRYPVGTEVVLGNDLGSGSTADVMRFVVTRRATDDSTVPSRLAEIEPLLPGPSAVRREWHFTRGVVHGHQGWTINGKPFDPHRMDARPRLGEVEVWRLFTDLHHPVHIHLSPFQVLRRGGRGPGRFDGGWKDTVDVRPAEFVDVAVRFESFAGTYLMHCHNLEHEDMAMMSAFETT
ncbi:FtsP/CotA-like multicopper oxidase with cupredoxin domain [Prauserella shujinwangii]|uniref:Multicopper oxidase CueO n=1 Tax=Prauserella shujinwangii TaxID=1453103 RepID=A0A2T0LQ55_9PSEU|nr:multicopper oxidase family protein [Prauserella shujinwangii]PRX45392.1 FtsP/CotA-like multicopper oxidase with cupredoxin domain [Prauserella shujinwangii]